MASKKDKPHKQIGYITYYGDTDWELMYFTPRNDDQNGLVLHKLPLLPEQIEKLTDKDSFTKMEFTIVPKCTNYNMKHFNRDCNCKSGIVDYAYLYIPEK